MLNGIAVSTPISVGWRILLIGGDFVEGRGAAEGCCLWAGNERSFLFILFEWVGSVGVAKFFILQV